MDGEDPAIHPIRGFVMLTMKRTNCRHAPVVAVDHVAGDQSVKFSIEIHCHSVIRNVRLCRIMNVIPKKKIGAIVSFAPKQKEIRFTATVP